MWELVKAVYTSLEKNGFQPELILLVMLIGFAGYIFYYFKKENKKQMELMGGIAESNKTIAKLLKDESSNIEKETVILTELSNSVSGLTYKIENLKNADERLTEQQAIIVYNLVIGEIFGDIKEAYYNNQQWLRAKEIDSNVEKRLKDRLNIIFEALNSDLVNKLSNFRYKDYYLKVYINEGFKQQMNEIKVFIHDSLIGDSNGIKEFLRNKHETFSSDFQIYLRSMNN